MRGGSVFDFLTSFNSTRQERRPLEYPTTPSCTNGEIVNHSSKMRLLRTATCCVQRKYQPHTSTHPLGRSEHISAVPKNRAAQLGQIDAIQEMIEADAIELDAQDVNGWTPLMHACCRGHKSVVAALLSAGASVEIESEDGRTALHRAATWSRLGPLDQVSVAKRTLLPNTPKMFILETPKYKRCRQHADHRELLISSGVTSRGMSSGNGDNSVKAR